MAKAKLESILTWIPLQAARERVAEVYLSMDYAGLWLIGEMAAERLRWRARAIVPSGYSLEGFWSYPSLSVNWSDNAATVVIVLSSSAAMGTDYLSIYGIEVACEDIERLAALPTPELQGTERQVYQLMKSDRPHKGDREYSRRLWEGHFQDKTTLKTIQNYVARHRKEFEIPEKTS